MARGRDEVTALIEAHGDHPVLYFIPDDGAFSVDAPTFDRDGEGNDCFML